MKNRTKNIVRGIKKNLNRFLSILFIVAIGSGFMAGLAATSPDMYETADKYIEELYLALNQENMIKNKIRKKEELLY